MPVSLVGQRSLLHLLRHLVPSRLFFFLFGGDRDVAVMLLMLVMGVGAILKFAGVVEECNCYGPLGGRAKAVDLSLAVILWVASASILYFSPHGRLAYDYVLFSLSLCCAALVGFIASYRTRLNPKGLDLNLKEHRSIETVVGFDLDGRPVALGQVAKRGPLMVFIALTRGCPTCATLKPALQHIASQFDNAINCIFLSSDDVELESFDGVALRVNQAFLESLGGENFLSA